MFRCTRCGNSIERAALIFAPPGPKTVFEDWSDPDLVYEFHICRDCWPELEDWIRNSDQELST